MIRRRELLAAAPALLALPGHALPERALRFPRDHGAHPELRTEWWYITGAVQAGERPFGFQLTFFRSRVDATQAMASGFAAKQLVFAHAAVTDVQAARLHHDQRIAREGFGVALADSADTRLRLRDWQLARGADGAYVARLPAGDFTLELRGTPTQPPLLQGANGLSRKGPDPSQASYYYSVPQLAVDGAITLAGRRHEVQGKAWLDHEWSEALMHPQAVGWDWIGMNLDDGGALTAFQLRRQDGSPLWDGGSFRPAGGSAAIASEGATRFSPQRRWSSPLTGASYPVEWQVQTPAGRYTVRALVDNQELDSRASTGAVYWEGLSDLLDAGGRRVGRGYLEMTGYAQRLRL
ncbi:carotenoid 1,2-hydratase [Ramlibacter tataouinensis]|uniref:lipocalin-like domain-containing protein n=1 Tax=Ramlibacter tataouinensis TaxID=94132 RepID=UPI0022F3A610|nr:carotenoid 1,2-hydratase [Ramlibacter tataouinensis]WBY01490.1 carotenoid 1,2-hydratase [Ramlibacter tataouinensis]